MMTHGVMSLYKLDIERLVSSTTINLQEAHAKILATLYIMDYSNFQFSARFSHHFLKEELIFMDMLRTHSYTCQKTKCYCKYFCTPKPYENVNHASDIQEELTNFKFMHTKEIYQTIVDIGGDQCDIWILLDYVALIMTLQPEAFSLILCKIYNLRLDKLSKLERFFVEGMISRILKQVNKTISNINSQLDANRFFEFKQSSIDFRASLLKATDQCLNFWNNYKEINPNFMMMLQQTKEINGKFKAIAKRWSTLKMYYGLLLFKEFKMYSTFLSVVENSTKACRELMFEFNAYVKTKLNNSRASTEYITRQTIQEERNVTVHVNMNLPSLGQITFTSNNIKNVFGWHASQLKNSHINKIVPDFMKEFHTERLLDHLKTGRNNKVFKNMLTFAKHQLGHVVPVYMYVTPHPDLEAGFCYIGVFRALKRRNDYILTDDKMNILTWTEDIGNDLPLEQNKSLLDLVTTKENRKSFLSLSQLYDEKNAKSDINDPSGKESKTATNFWNSKIEIFGISGMSYFCEIDPRDKINMKNVTLLVLEKSFNHLKKTKTNNEEQEFVNYFPDNYDENAIKLNDVVFVPSEKAMSQSLSSVYDDISAIQAKNICMSPVPDCQTLPSNPFDVKPSFASTDTKNVQFDIKVIAPVDQNEIMQQDEVETDTLKNQKDSSEGNSKSFQADEDEFKFKIGIGSSIAATSVTSKASSAWRELHEINLLIQEKPRAKCLTFLTSLLILNSALILGGTITVNSYASNLVDQNREIAIIMRDSTLRLYYYLEIHRRVRIITMIAENFISNDFNTTQIMVTNYNQIQLDAISVIARDFSAINNVLINGMHILDESLINELFQHVNLTARRQGEPNVVVPISGAAYEYMQMIVTLQNEDSIGSGDSAAQYILKNTLNDILIRSEEIPQILLNAVKQLDDKVQNILLYLIIGLIFLMATLTLAIIRTEYKYAREKSRFISMVMRCEDKELEQSISILKDFTVAMGSKIDGQYTQLSEIKLKIMRDGENSRKGKKISKKVNTAGVNRGSYNRVFISVGFLMVALAPLLSSILLFQNFINDINNLNANLVANDNLLSKYVLCYIELYEYLSLNQTSLVRGQSINQEFTSDLHLVKDQFDFFSKISTGDPANDIVITSLMKGNLCDIFKSSLKSDYDKCVTLGEGSATSGLFGITAYMTRIVSRGKLEFDYSDKSDATIHEMLNQKSLREVEILFDLIFQLPFFSIDSVLIDSIRLRTDTFQIIARYIDILCIFVTLIFGAWGFKVYYIDGLNERKQIRMMLKIFPPKLVKNQGKIRNYLASEMGNMFDS